MKCESKNVFYLKLLQVPIASLHQILPLTTKIPGPCISETVFYMKQIFLILYNLYKKKPGNELSPAGTRRIQFCESLVLWLLQRLGKELGFRLVRIVQNRAFHQGLNNEVCEIDM